MQVLACFISSNPDSLDLSLSAHSANFTDETRVIVLDTPSTHERNAAIAKDYNAIHVEESAFRKSVRDEFKPLFQGRYGGNRNICLYHAFKEGAHAVFFDDDTTPYENPLGQYARLFSEGKKIIAGKYLRHAQGTPQIIRDAVDALAAYSDKDAGAEETKEKLLQFFSGIPQETQRPLRGVGTSGGNLGVSFECLSHYCFFPTDYRVEDGTYGVLAKHFVGEEPFNQEDNPAVYHNKTPKENALLENLSNELKGNSIALCIKDSLEENELGADSAEEKAERNSQLVFKAFNLDYALYKERQKSLSQKAGELGFAGQWSELLSHSSRSFRPTQQEVEAKTALFNYAQDNWRKALAAEVQ